MSALLLHDTAHFDALGECHAEGVDARGETSEVDGGLPLEGGDAASGVVVHVDAQHLIVSLDGHPARGGVGVERQFVVWRHLVRAVGGLGAAVPFRHAGGGACQAEGDVVDVVAAVVSGVVRSQDVAEGDVVAAAGVVGEVDGVVHRKGGAGVVDEGHGDKGVRVGEVAHHAHLQLVLGLCLLDVDAQLEGAYVAVVGGHGIDASLVEEEAVVAAVSVGGTVVNHGHIVCGHADIPVGECPAFGFDTRLGGSGSGVGVEVIAVGQVGTVEGASFGEDDVVDIVAAVVAGLSRGQYVAEGDVMTAACVGGEVDSAEHRCGGAAVVDSGHGHERRGVVQVGHHTHLQLVFGLPLFDVHTYLQGAHVAVEVGHGIDAALVEEEAVVAAVGVGGGIVYHRLVLVGHAHVLVCQRPAGGFDAGLGGCGGGVGVEVVGVGQVGHMERAGRGVDGQGEVVDKVAAEVADGDIGVTEGDVMSAAGVTAEVDDTVLVVGGAGIAERGHGDKGVGVGKVAHDAHGEAVVGVGLF